MTHRPLPPGSLPSIRLRPIGAILLALAVWGSDTQAGEEALGRLFFTPERRQALDRQRQYNLQDNSHATEAPVVTLNGVVQRSSGHRSAWVNGTVQHDDEDLSGIRVRPGQGNPGQATLRDGGNGSVNTLGIGDSLRRGTSETEGLLPDGSQIRIHRLRPPVEKALP